MSDLVAGIVGAVLLLAALGWATARPRGWPEAAAAVPLAALAVAVGLISPPAALQAVGRLGPTLLFLGAVLLIGRLAEAEGVFRWLGGVLAGTTRPRSPAALFTTVFVVAAATTAVLSLDATVVLLTPVVVVAARRRLVPAAPSVYVTAHLANTASLLFPVSNLTNLLAFHATGLSFLTFSAAMTLPWLGALGVEYLVCRWHFRRELAPVTEPPPAADTGTGGTSTKPPWGSLIALAALLAGFALAPLLGLDAAWVAAIGAMCWVIVALLTGRIGLRSSVQAVNLPFLVFVAALGVIVAAATGHGWQARIAGLLPRQDSLPALLAVAAVAAVLANLLNNLPATLLLISALAGSSPLILLAVLIGVNVGPNLSYTGSLATLLWRRLLIQDHLRPSLRRFTLLGLLTTPPAIAVAVVALWSAGQLLGLAR